MAVDNPKVIDIVINNGDECELVIVDHLPWDNIEEIHLSVLIEKLESYLAAIESGEIQANYPAFQWSRYAISILLTHDAPTDQRINFRRLKASLARRGVSMIVKADNIRGESVAVAWLDEP